MQSDEQYMKRALELARRAGAEGEVPIGALIVWRGQVIAEAYNRMEQTQQALLHAEVQCIEQASAALGSWRLEETALYVTLEPCPMCAGAILQSRIPRVIYGAADPKAGCAGSLYNLLDDARFNHRCDVSAGVLGIECGSELTGFFRALRARKKKERQERSILQQE